MASRSVRRNQGSMALRIGTSKMADQSQAPVYRNGSRSVKLSAGKAMTVENQPNARTKVRRTQARRARPTTASTSHGWPERNRMRR